MEMKDSWEQVNNKLIRTYYFDKSHDITAFVNKVMGLAQKHKNYPEMVIRSNYVKLTISDNDKVTDKCHNFALSVDKIR